jgi:hypothetical protein
VSGVSKRSFEGLPTCYKLPDSISPYLDHPCYESYEGRDIEKVPGATAILVEKVLKFAKELQMEHPKWKEPVVLLKLRRNVVNRYVVSKGDRSVFFCLRIGSVFLRWGMPRTFEELHARETKELQQHLVRRLLEKIVQRQLSFGKLGRDHEETLEM